LTKKNTIETSDEKSLGEKIPWENLGRILVENSPWGPYTAGIEEEIDMVHVHAVEAAEDKPDYDDQILKMADRVKSLRDKMRYNLTPGSPEHSAAGNEIKQLQAKMGELRKKQPPKPIEVRKLSKAETDFLLRQDFSGRNDHSGSGDYSKPWRSDPDIRESKMRTRIHAVEANDKSALWDAYQAALAAYRKAADKVKAKQAEHDDYINGVKQAARRAGKRPLYALRDDPKAASSANELQRAGDEAKALQKAVEDADEKFQGRPRHVHVPDHSPHDKIGYAGHYDT
jgi:hypothetical protein